MEILIDDAVLEIQTFNKLKIPLKDGKTITFIGEHYYGRISGLKNNKWTFIELAHNMSTSFAKELSTDDFQYHAGAMTQRFKTREDVVDFAIRNVQNIFPHCNRLICEDNIIWEIK